MNRSSRRLPGISRHRQDGAVLLAFMLVLIVGSAYLIVGRLNEYSQAYKRDLRTHVTMQNAKRALIMYAMNYPDMNPGNANAAPGMLPCPDLYHPANALAGTATPGCSDTGQALGRLPYRTIGLEEARDSDGERLWYAVSANFLDSQAAPDAINSETAAQIAVDDADDVVAVIIAPGRALTGAPLICALTFTDQIGRPSANPADYIEYEYSTTVDPDTEEPVQTLAAPVNPDCPLNDTMMTITRQELMQAVEQRVIAEVAGIFSTFKQTYGRYPWLSAWGDADFNGTSGVRAGTIPFHADGQEFDTDYSIAWSTSGSSISVSASGTSSVYQSAVASAIAGSDGTVSSHYVSTVADGTCTWYREDRAACRFSDNAFLSGIASTSSGSPGSTGLLNLYDTSMKFSSAGIKRGDLVVNLSRPSAAVASGTRDDDADPISLQIQDDGTAVLVDTDRNFGTLGVVPRSYLADIATADGTASYIVRTVSGSTLTLVPLPDQPAVATNQFSYSVYQVARGIVNTVSSNTTLSIRTVHGVDLQFNAGDTYRIFASSRQFNQNADAGTNIDSFIVYESSGTFPSTLLRPGDAVENTTFGGIGTITQVGSNWFRYTRLQGGTYPDIFQNEGYRIHYVHVDRREYDLDFIGGVYVYTEQCEPDPGAGTECPEVDGSKTRSVCLGYGTECITSPTSVSLTQSEVGPMVTLSDYSVQANGSDLEIGQATLTAGAGATGSARVRNIHFDLVEPDDSYNLVQTSAELPAWFVPNGWHTLTYLAYSDGPLVPGSADGEPSCSEDDNKECIALTIQRPSGTESQGPFEGLAILSAGPMLSTNLDPADENPVRKSGLDGYFEDVNSDGTLSFHRGYITSGFNDQLRLVVVEN
jgi:hypothetical protein